jgi:hypothetical protein
LEAIMKRTLFALAVVGCVSMPAPAQNVVSARAGLVNYTEGVVTLRDEPVRLTTKQTYVEMKDNDVLRTARGRAEVLLSPGVVMRLAEESAVRLVSGSLTDTRVAVLQGDVVIEASELFEGSRVRVALADREADLAKVGLYRFTSDPAEIRVYDGRIEVPSGNPDKPTIAKKGSVVSMGNGLIARKFDTDEGDTFYRWASRRSGYIAMANVSSARMLQDDYYGYGFRSGWIYNPYLGIMTFIPMNGSIYSPFGYRYYTPRTVYAVFAPPPPVGGGGAGPSMGGFDRTPSYNPNYGYNTVGARSGGGMSSSGSMGAGPAPSTPAAAASDGGDRSGGGGMGRGSSGAGGRGK